MSSKDKKKKKPNFKCQMFYRNDLPEIPFEPKLTQHEFDITASSGHNDDADAEFAYMLHASEAVSVPIDLVLASEDINDPTEINPMDIELIEFTEADVTSRSVLSGEDIRSTVSWLKKTQYISNKYDVKGSSTTSGYTKTASSSASSSASSYGPGSPRDIETSTDSVASISDSFQTDWSRFSDLKHKTKKGVVAVECYSVCPKFVVSKRESAGFLPSSLYFEDGNAILQIEVDR